MSQLPPLPSGATAAEYVEKRWGIRTRLVPLNSVAVNITDTILAKNNPRRFMLMLINFGTGTVYVNFGAAPVAGSSVPLSPNGGALTLEVDEDGELTTYDIHAIASAAGNNVGVWEVESL